MSINLVSIYNYIIPNHYEHFICKSKKKQDSNKAHSISNAFYRCNKIIHRKCSRASFVLCHVKLYIFNVFTNNLHFY